MSMCLDMSTVVFKLCYAKPSKNVWLHKTNTHLRQTNSTNSDGLTNENHNKLKSMICNFSEIWIVLTRLHSVGTFYVGISIKMCCMHESMCTWVKGRYLEKKIWYSQCVFVWSYVSMFISVFSAFVSAYRCAVCAIGHVYACECSHTYVLIFVLRFHYCESFWFVSCFLLAIYLHHMAAKSR